MIVRVEPAVRVLMFLCTDVLSVGLLAMWM